METYLRKFELIQNLSFTLETDKQTFARRLADGVDYGDTGMFSGTFEAWESSGNDYKGQVTNDGFKIRKRRTFFETQGVTPPQVIGSFSEQGDNLVVDAEIKPHTKGIAIILVFIVIFYTVAISVITVSAVGGGNNGLFIVLPFVLLHMILMIGIPFYFLKRSVARTKKDLKRDFFYIAHGEAE